MYVTTRNIHGRVTLLHGVQSSLAPGCAENFPGTQLVHEDCEFAPETVENFPILQGVHAFSVVADVASKNLPAAQSVHCSDPIPDANFPGLHCWQAEDPELSA